MSSVNRVTLLGNAGRDAEVRYMPSGKAVTTVSLATSSRRKDPQSGEMLEDTQWHRLTFYDRLAEVAGEYVKKGKSIYVEGRLKYGKYTDKDGVERNTTDIIVNELQLLGGRDEAGEQPQRPAHGSGSSNGSNGSNGHAARAPQQQAAGYAQQRTPGQRARAAAQGGGSGFDDMDSDIPF